MPTCGINIERVAKWVAAASASHLPHSKADGWRITGSLNLSLTPFFRGSDVVSSEWGAKAPRTLLQDEG